MSEQPRIIKCKYCHTRTPNNLQVCPNCGVNLEPKPFPYLSWGIAVIIVGAIIYGYIQLNPMVQQQSQNVAEIVSPPTDTPTATATRTPTLIPTATSTNTPTNTPTSTATPTPTDTATPTPTQTPTPEPTKPNAPTSTPTATFTPTPRFTEIIITSPEDGILYSKDSEIVLEWEAAGELADDEWYAVRLNWLQNGERAFGGTNVKDTFWIVPANQYYGLADLGTGRVYEWHVFIEQVIIDEAGESSGISVSPTSKARTFFWP